MKPLITIYTITTILCFTMEIQAQKVLKEEVVYTYTQLPLQPLPEFVKTYSVKLENKTNGSRYDATYNSPIGRMKYSGKSYNGVKDIIYQDDSRAFAKKYFVLPGYTKSATPDLQITFKLGLMHYKTKNLDPVVSNGKKLERKEITFTMPTSMIAKTSNGEVIYEEEIYGKNYQFKKVTKEWDGLVAGGGYNTHFVDAGSIPVENAYIHLSNILWSVLGKPTVSKKFEIQSFTSKKHDYSSLHQAQEKLLEAIAKMTNGDDSQTELNEVIETYDMHLKEANPDDKKAKINDKVMEGIQYNLAIAYLLSAKFQEAKEVIAKRAKKASAGNKMKGLLKMAGISRQKPMNAKELENLIISTEKRYKANGLI